MSISSISSHSTTAYNPFSKIEDSNGKISRDSFVKNRPSGISSDEAGSLFDTADTSKSGSLTESQLVQGLQNQAQNQTSSSSSGSSSSEDSNAFTGFLPTSFSNSTFASLIQNQGQNSSSGSDPLSSIADSNGNVSRDSFVKNRPSGVSADDAGSLFDSIDTSKSGSLATRQLETGLKSKASSQTSDASSTSDSSGTSLIDYLLKADKENSKTSDSTSTSSSKTVSRSDFVKNRPPGVSESDAGSLFDSIDTNKTGSLTTSQLEDGFKSKAKQQQSGSTNLSLVNYLTNDDSSSSSSNSSDSTSDTSSTSNKNNSLEELLKAIKSYTSHFNSSSSTDISSLLQTA
jgi:hypothetical protein